jgi:triacylglycerol lipase
MTDTTGTVSRARGLLAAGAFLAAVVHGGVAASAQADPAPTTPYPVPGHFLTDAVTGALQGGAASPPGTNDWSCRPTAEHPEPVILVHGLFANRNDNWQTFGPLLANNGYCVFALTYGTLDGDPTGLLGGLGPMERSADTLDAFVDRVRAETGAAQVDLVGHSEGATMPYWYIKMGHGAGKVAKMIGLAPLVHGTGGTLLRDTGITLASGDRPAPAEFAADSPFMRQLNDGGITVPGVTYTQIVTRYDQVVVPYTSGLIAEPGTTNFTVQDQCPEDLADHLSINSDPIAARDVLNALDPEHTQPVECTLVLPAIGVVPDMTGR